MVTYNPFTGEGCVRGRDPLGPFGKQDNWIEVIPNKTNKPMNDNRKYLPTIAELIDRLSITQMKEILIPKHKEEYAQEIKDIIHDIDLILLDEMQKANFFDAEDIRNIIVLTLMNRWIWENEGNFRKGIKNGNNLELTHGLNGLRNIAKNKIQESFGGRKDYKIDNVEAFKDWIPSGYDK